MTSPRILTIGHSNHPLERFLALLSKHGVTAVADVRSAPYSRFCPHFNRDVLTTALKESGIRYSYLGRELGGRSDDPMCYQDGQIQFERVARTDLFRSADAARKGWLMAFVRQRYGKANVRVLRVQRDAGRHEVREARIGVTLDGDFARAYTAADNSSVVPTDTMKNLVNVLALEHLGAANEPFALAIAQCFLDRYEQVAEAQVEIDETVWNRMSIAGRPHEHNFVRSESGTPFARVTATRSARAITAGIRDLAIMKTTGSGFVDYLQDEYTTLPPTSDRILATRLCATWRFAGADRTAPIAFGDAANSIRCALLQVFATSYSHSVQDSLYRMGEAALAAAPAIEEVTLAMPNVHYLPIDLSAFGRDAKGRLFLPTDEPNGQIEATLRRQ